jgi:hypothetical protein
MATQAELQAQLDRAKSPEFLAEQEAAARLAYEPQLANIQLSESRARKQSDLSRQGIELGRNTLEGDINESIRRIKRQQQEQEANFLNKQQNLGIRSSGLTLTGLSNIGSETGITLSRIEQDRANRLAQFALQEANVEDTLANAIRQAEISKQQLEFDIAERRDAAVQDEQARVEALMNQIISASRGRGGSSGSSGLPEDQERWMSAWNEGIMAFEDLDMRGGGTRDRFFSDDEWNAAKERVHLIAQNYGVDPGQLFGQLSLNYNFQRWDPDQAQYYQYRNYDPIIPVEGGEGSAGAVFSPEELAALQSVFGG